ncbi:uncharacterized protein LOC117176615 [Belonocnema kinseyi]|uniref:uncharacterized protein LOC117176615 n=1 Tax=Belonocnema kinseyi TaxID=2817044 RepID=UPI00143CD85E|nr:uncharacterized protein LOC117176615 [Belonocnema kinseyi]
MAREMSKEDLSCGSQEASTMMDGPIKFITEKLSGMETFQKKIEDALRILNAENSQHAKEIEYLAKQGNMLLTEDESSGKREKYTSCENRVLPEPENSSIPAQGNKQLKDPLWQSIDIQKVENSSLPPLENNRTDQAENYGQRVPVVTQHPQESTTSIPVTTSIPAKDIIRTVEELRGRDDVDLEDFIKSVKRAKSRCSQPDLLLDFIIAEKIKDQAKRGIRFSSIDDYDQLFSALRQNVGIISSVELSRSKLESVKQTGIETVQNYNMRFRQHYNEIIYAVQNEQSNPTSRRLAIQIEEKSAIKKYIMNLKDEIGAQVRSLRPSTLNEDQQEALESEVWYREKHHNRYSNVRPPGNKPLTKPAFAQSKTAFQHASSASKYPSINNPPNDSLPLQQRLQMFCKICKRPGHNESQCYSRDRNFPIGHSNSRSPNRIYNLQVEEEHPENVAGHHEDQLSTEIVSAISGRLFSIRANLHGTNRTGRLLVDSGSSLNLIKDELVQLNHPREKCIKVFSMGNDQHRTNQITKFKFQGKEHVFVIVPNDFPLPEDGIIGAPFMYNKGISQEIRTSPKADPLPCTNLAKHEIILKEERPINIPSYRQPECHKAEINRQVKEMLNKRVISMSKSPFNSPLWVVPKKADASGKKKWRIVIDFRKLNERTDLDAYPLPIIDDILDHLGNAKFLFSI